MISKWWWLCRQKFIVSWESSKLLLVHSYTFHTFHTSYTFYTFTYTLPLGLLFSIHRQCFLRFQGIVRTQGVPNTFMYFHIILNIWCFLHLLTLEILLTFSHFTSQPYKTEFLLLLRNVFYPSKFGAFYVYFQPVSPARTAWF